MFALLRLIPLREAPWPGGSVAGSPWGRPLLMSSTTIGRGCVKWSFAWRMVDWSHG